VVESYCRQFDIDWTWKDDGGLRTVERRAALATHPRSGVSLWFNQATLWHPSNAPVPVQLTAASRQKLPLYVEFANGDMIDTDDLAQVRAAYARHKRWFGWKQGDVLILDNWLMTHGRRPFTGKRKIAVAMRSTAA
jgi:alpha-ketoglutarate-dependent taurine dioxygenase